MGKFLAGIIVAAIGLFVALDGLEVIDTGILASLLDRAGSTTTPPPTSRPAELTGRNSSATPVRAIETIEGREEERGIVQPGELFTHATTVGSQWVFRDASSGEETQSLVVRTTSQAAEIGATEGIVVSDADYKPVLEIRFVTKFEFLWNDDQSGAQLNVAAYRVDDSALPEGFQTLGHIMVPRTAVDGVLAIPIVRDISHTQDALRPAIQYHQAWTNLGGGAGEYWAKIETLEPPEGYRALGSILVTPWTEDKEDDKVVCVRRDLTEDGAISRTLTDGVISTNHIWHSYKMAASWVRILGLELSQKSDGFTRFSSGSFVAVRPIGESESEFVASATQAFEEVPFFNHGAPDPRHAHGLRVRLDYLEDPTVSDLGTLPEVSEGWPNQGDRTRWKLARAVRIPLTYVKDHSSLEYRIENTPIYTAEKYVCWQAFKPILGANQGAADEITFRNEAGVMRGSESTFSVTTGIKVTQEVSVDVGIASSNTSVELSVELGISETERVQFTEIKGEDKTIRIEPGTNCVHWKPIYKYVLRRGDGQTVGDPAFTQGDLVKRLVYTDEEARHAFATAGPLTDDE